jgi:hypothetical protein
MKYYFHICEIVVKTYIRFLSSQNMINSDEVLWHM